MAANIHHLVQRWKKIDISQLQTSLDEAATALAERQDASEESRRRLVDQSRDFKRTVPEDVRQTVAPLLKSFQTEVDALGRRAKAAEAAFLHVYKRVVEMPDPVASLEAVQHRAARAHELEAENGELRDSLRAVGAELRLHSNNDIAVKKLQEKLKEYEVTLQEQLKEQESQLRQEGEEQLTSLAVKLEEAEKKVVHLQSALENSQSELMGLKSRYDEVTQSKFEELELMMSDLERANQRAAVADKELSALKERLEAGGPNAPSAPAPERAALEMELSAKEKQISHLMDDLQRLQSTLAMLKETSASKIAQLEELLAEKDRTIRALEVKLHEQRDYEEIKNELSIFRATELPDSPKPQPLQVALLEKNKALQSENTSLKVAQAEISDQLKTSLRENVHLATLVEQQTTTISRLEQDLSRVVLLSEKESDGGLPPEIVAESNHEAEGGARSSGLMEIVSGQRERLRMKCEQLEVERDLHKNRSADLATALETSRVDNVRLYEKIRFLQSYNERPKTSSDPEAFYSDQYEKKLDPFSAFSHKEKQRKYMNLSPFEKVTYTLGRTILSNRIARTMAFFYTLFLHCLIFLVLYKLAYTQVCQQDRAAECNERWMNHMQQVHNIR